MRMLQKHAKLFLIQLYYTIIYYIPNVVRDIITMAKGKHSIAVKVFLDTRWGRYRKQNWGDDMNMVICNHWFHCNLISYATSVFSWLFSRENYALVGSILQSANKRTIVWGSGLISDKEFPKENPKQICAVRGPLSRQVLLSHGIKCPEVYGDPILLLSKYYQPQVKKIYKLGIIPHIYDENIGLIDKYIENHSSVIKISMRKYSNWKDVIDKIASCEQILSSSLHGIILADTYGVPNTWVEFSDKVFGHGFKFRDYFLSVKRPINAAIAIRQEKDIVKIEEQESNYTGIDIDLDLLVQACPFTLQFKN